jgi:hypothetical protein
MVVRSFSLRKRKPHFKKVYKPEKWSCFTTRLDTKYDVAGEDQEQITGLDIHFI